MRNKLIKSLSILLLIVPFSSLHAMHSRLGTLLAINARRHAQHYLPQNFQRYKSSWSRGTNGQRNNNSFFNRYGQCAPMLLASSFFFANNANNSNKKNETATLRDYDINKDWAFLMDQCKNNAHEFDENRDCSKSFTYAMKICKDHDNLSTKVLVRDKQRVGFITYFQVINLPKVGMVQYLSVTEENRGQGFANMMVQKAIEDLENRGSTMLIVSIKNDNIVSLKLFKKHGFEVYSEDFFGNVVLTKNHDPILMKKLNL